MRVRLRLLLEEGEYKIHKITHFGNFSSKALGAVDCQKYFLDKKDRQRLKKSPLPVYLHFLSLYRLNPEYTFICGGVPLQRYGHCSSG